MRGVAPTTVALMFSLVVLFCVSPAHASARVRSNRPRVSSHGTDGPRLKGVGATVAVQPFDGPGPSSEQLRGLVVRIVRGRGLHPMTSLPRYDGTGQYPALARDHTLAAFVTADMEERGQWQKITFLVWNGRSGSVLGRWTASARTPVLARAVGKGFWPHLGPALLRAEAPAPNRLAPAAPMRIDASATYDPAPVAARE